MNFLIDTCVLPRSHLETAEIYRETFGPSLGFELLMMFDLPDFRDNLDRNLALFEQGPLIFHEPVWGVEHSAPPGSPAEAEGRYHMEQTLRYARMLRPEKMVYHLNNYPIVPGEKDRMLQTSLDNLAKLREQLPDVVILTENTGTRLDGTMLLDQSEFTDLCRSMRLPVMIDIGHANANSWDLFRLVCDLRDQIGGYHLHNNDGIHDLHNRLNSGTVDYAALVPYLARTTPDASFVIEYTRSVFHGQPLIEDIAMLKQLAENMHGNTQEG